MAVTGTILFGSLFSPAIEQRATAGQAVTILRTAQLNALKEGQSWGVALGAEGMVSFRTRDEPTTSPFLIFDPQGRPRNSSNDLLTEATTLAMEGGTLVISPQTGYARLQ